MNPQIFRAKSTSFAQDFRAALTPHFTRNFPQPFRRISEGNSRRGRRENGRKASGGGETAENSGLRGWGGGRGGDFRSARRARGVFAALSTRSIRSTTGGDRGSCPRLIVRPKSEFSSIQAGDPGREIFARSVFPDHSP
jgi:hypothetical protein